jgi:hypothetical protein
MQSQFFVIPPLSESAQEVPSYVCQASQLHQIFAQIVSGQGAVHI